MTHPVDSPRLEEFHAIVDGVDVDAVHDLVALCPGIAGVGSGLPGAMATYLPGRRIPGVRVNPDSIELEVSIRWESSAEQVAALLRSRLGRLVAGRRIDVTFVDIELPREPLAPAELPAGLPVETPVETPERSLG